MTRPADQIVVRPVLSEKHHAAMAGGRYVFRCRLDANKIEIRRAIEELFSVRVTDVNTHRVKGKERGRSRNRRSRIRGFDAAWKKAWVTLAPGEKIEGLFEGT